MTEVLTRYSLEEVAKRDGSNGARIWIVINDMVIDVTDSIDQHPGGAEVIMEHAGKDATKAFSNVGHSTEAKKYMKNSTIGELIEEDKKANKGQNKSPTKTTETSKRSVLSIITCGIWG